MNNSNVFGIDLAKSVIQVCKMDKTGGELIFNKAVSQDNQEVITLHYENSDSFTTSASIFGNNNREYQLTVDATSLKAIITDNSLDKIDFIKIDCEGSEYEILYSTPSEIFDQISVMSIETHKGSKENENIKALASFLESNKFNIYVKRDIIWAWK